MKEFSPIIYFFFRLILIYILLTVVYDNYLKSYSCEECSRSDPYTELVAGHSKQGMQALGYMATIEQDPLNPQLGLFVSGNLASIINEGCNAAAIMIIFIAFVYGFYSGFWKTFVFTVLGLFIIYVVNIIRVIWLTYIYYAYPEYSVLAHDYVFPLIIYGIIVLLWVLWIWKFALPYWNKKYIDAEST